MEEKFISTHHFRGFSPRSLRFVFWVLEACSETVYPGSWKLHQMLFSHVRQGSDWNSSHHGGETGGL
jgi:hypothetical protein